MSGFEPLVAFNNNFDDSDLYYFDFNDNTWKGCEPIGRLPYDLCKYRAINSDHEFITCVDSYCLTNNLEDVLSNDEMHKEKEWRDSIVKAKEEVKADRESAETEQTTEESVEENTDDKTNSEEDKD